MIETKMWCHLLAVLVCSSSAATTFISGGAEEIGSPLRVAQCRAQCLQRFSNGPNKEFMCLQGPDCFMCWENCELLQSNFPVWGAMCSVRAICFPGCQQACRFHRETASQQVQQTQPVIHTRGEEVVKMTGVVARWPRPPTTSPNSPLVYVVMRRQSVTSSSWRQVTQTVDLTARLPSDSNLSPTTVRVLVVDPEGLVTIYSPVTPSTAATSGVATGADVFSNKMLSKVMAGHRKKINTEIHPTTTKSPIMLNGNSNWELREVSLIHQKVLVIAEVAWEPRVKRAVYLVTWEVDGGGLKGNLFTDSTCVTLSLWPDTVYHIQVELVTRTGDRHSERSETLVIDTHRASLVSFETGLNSDKSHSVSGSEERIMDGVDVQSPGGSAISSPLLSVLVNRGIVGDLSGSEERRQQMELLAGTGTAVLLFLVVVGTLVWRCRKYRHCSSSQASLITGSTTIKSKKLIEEVSSLRKGFQPIVTMVSETSGNTYRGVAGNLMASGRSSLSSQASATSSTTTSNGGVINPSLLHTSPWHDQSQHVYTSTSSFLKAAERGARNEVQV